MEIIDLLQYSKNYFCYDENILEFLEYLLEEEYIQELNLECDFSYNFFTNKLYKL